MQKNCLQRSTLNKLLAMRQSSYESDAFADLDPSMPDLEEDA